MEESGGKPPHSTANTPEDAVRGNRGGKPPPRQAKILRNHGSGLADGVASRIEGAFFRFSLVAQPPFRECCKIIGEGFDDGAQFQVGEPAIGNRFNSSCRSKKIAGDRACRVAVSAVIYGEDGPVFKILCAQRAVQSHGQGFFRYEPFPGVTPRATLPSAGPLQAFPFFDGGSG